MKRKGIFLLSLVVMAALGVSTAAALQVEALKPVIIDTDMGGDDWMAILYLLQRQDVQVLAITVSGAGQTSCDAGVQNAMNLLALAGNPDIPVACGRETPLLGTNVFPQTRRYMADRLYGHELEPNPNPLLDMTAIELLQKTLDDAVDSVTVLELGPATNLAELLDVDPGALEQIRAVYMMAGAIEVLGDVSALGTASQEWNAYIDPFALAKVIGSGLPVTLIPLDATNQAPATMRFYQKLLQHRATPEANFVDQVLSGAAPDFPLGYFFWDQVAAVTLTDERVVTIENQTITVVTEEGDEFGRTVVDTGGYPVRVAMAVDAELFEQIFLNVLNGRDPDAAL